MLEVLKSGPATANVGDTITYTYVVTNPGDVPLRYVTVGDNPQCSPILLNPAGDTNSNGLLDTTETWVYTCTAVLTETTTNTATAERNRGRSIILVSGNAAMSPGRCSGRRAWMGR